jgi:thioredoxin 2
VSNARVDTVTCPHCAARNRVPPAASGVPHCGRCHKPVPWLTTAADDDFDAVVVNSTLPVLLDLWAPWCQPCRIVEPGVERAASTFAGSLKVVKVNVDAATKVAQRLAAGSIPMLLILEGGKERGKQVGALGPDAAEVDRIRDLVLTGRRHRRLWAQAPADIVTAVISTVEGRRGSPLTEAADGFD